MTTVVVDAAEDRPSDAALDAVEGAWAVVRCDVRASPGSWPCVAEARRVGCQGPADAVVGKIWFVGVPLFRLSVAEAWLEGCQRPPDEVVGKIRCVGVQLVRL